MYDDTSPIASPHPELTNTERNVHDPVLLYNGILKGRWLNGESIAEEYQGTPEAIAELAGRLSKGVEGDSEVRLALSPSPHISWIFSTDEWPIQAGWPVPVPPKKISSAFATRMGTVVTPDSLTRKKMATGTSRIMSPIQVGASDKSLDEVRFYLVNFQILQLVDSVRRGEDTDVMARLSLSQNEWRIVVESLPNLEFTKAIHYLEEQRGYAITHICRIWREDSKGIHSTFTFEEVESVLEAMQLFASFVRGGMVGVALPVGFRNGISEFEQWSVTSTDPGRYPEPHRDRPFPGWYLRYDHPPFERRAARWLHPLFGQFAAKWWHTDAQLQELWRKVFRGLVLTYMDAERMDQSRAIVPACTALETLAWAILVEKENWLTGNRQPGGGRSGYDSLTAADRLRLLLRWAGLPTEVPASLPKLWKEVQGRDKKDGPQIVTWVRNHVVHPDRRDQLENGMAREAWLLAMCYTELVILRLLSYDGYFRDRLDAEEIKRVPWVTASTASG